MEELSSGCISKMVDSTSATLLAELDRKRKRLQALPFAIAGSVAIVALLLLMGSGAWVLIPVCILLMAGILLAYYWDLLKKSVVMMYDLDDQTASTYRRLHESLIALGQCGAAWHIDARSDVYDPKYHAGAGHLVRRKSISIGEQHPPFVRTNIPVIRIPAGDRRLYFFPDTVLIYTSNGVGAVNYDDFRLECAPTRFIEDGSVPRDAKIVDRTWRYVNKKGGPDRRFNDNRELPICEYEAIRFHSNSGLNEHLQASLLGIGVSIEDAVRGMTTILAILRKSQLNQSLEHFSEPVVPTPMLSTDTIATKMPSKDARVTMSSSTSSPPSMDEVFDSLFRILCCVMVSDGRASSAEKARIAELMHKVGAAWEAELINERIAGFIETVEKVGFGVTLTDALSRIPQFKAIRRSDILLKCIDLLTMADSAVSDAELAILAKVRQTLNDGSA